MTKLEILEVAKNLFFKAMLHNHHKLKEIHDSETFLFKNCLQTTKLSNKTVGTITIYYNKIPVWWMSCCGFCKKEALPFLIEARTKAYETGEFIGGHGVSELRHANLIYLNMVKPKHDFSCFDGVEIIEEYTNDCFLNDLFPFAYFKYCGMSLLNENN